MKKNKGEEKPKRRTGKTAQKSRPKGRQDKRMSQRIKEVIEKDRERFKDLDWNKKPPTTKEVMNIIKRFKRGKAPGPDGITTDLVKDLDEDGLKELTKLIRKWWVKREVPNTLTLARVVSLYKRRPRKQENYRPISLLNTFYKIIATAIQRRLAGTLDSLIMKQTIRVQEKQEHHRCIVRSQKNARIHGKGRTERGNE